MKYALVTGGSRGIGKAVCLKLSQLGYAVIINYSNNSVAADETKTLVERNGGIAELMQFDVSNKEQVEHALTLWEEAFRDEPAEEVEVVEETVAESVEAEVPALEEDLESEEEDDDYPYVDFITARPTEPLVELITPRPTAPLVEMITPTPKPVEYPSASGVIGYSNQRIPTRSGPGTMYDEPGSFFSAGQEVKVVGKSWDDNNHLYWYHLEFEYKDAWYRLYTTDGRIDVANVEAIPDQPARGDALDTQYSLYDCDIYYGPGENYAKVRNVTMLKDKRCDVYVIEDGWA